MAIQNAASVAALLITTEAMVAEVPKKNAGGGMPAGGGGMGGMGGMDYGVQPFSAQKEKERPGSDAGPFCISYTSISTTIAAWR